MPTMCSFLECLYRPPVKRGDASNFYDRKNPHSKKGGKK